MFDQLLENIMQANQAGNPDYEAYLIGTKLKLEKYSGQTDYPELLKRLQVLAKHHAVAANSLGLYHALNFYRSNKRDKKELSEARDHLWNAADMGNLKATLTFALLMDFEHTSQKEYDNVLNMLLTNIKYIDKELHPFTSDIVNLIYMKWLHTPTNGYNTVKPCNIRKYQVAMARKQVKQKSDLGHDEATRILQRKSLEFFEFNVSNPPDPSIISPAV